MEVVPNEIQPQADDVAESQFLILGTAGHIDHGKTTLIEALTGTDTDRLPEEKRRGITIELGFAELNLGSLRFGIVDVPGHQRFVKTMLSGATGIDVALLVVAADDSINRQTREHLEILNYLQVPAGVVAITKADRVDDQWLELVVDEVQQLLEGSCLEDSPIIITSAVEGRGLERLKTALEQAGIQAAGRRDDRRNRPFVMPIDRVFSVPGQGTVVTGSITHGQIEVGQSVQLVPGTSEPIRIRQIQTHDQKVSRIERGQRAALNLAGISVDQAKRGDLLVEPGSLTGSRCLTVKVPWQVGSATRLKHHQLVRFHVGTMEVLGQLRWLSQTQAPSVSAAEHRWSTTDVASLPGRWAQILLQQETAVSWHQPIVLRQVTPIETLGVAMVVSSSLPKQHHWTEQDLKFLHKADATDVCDRLEAAVYFERNGVVDPSTVCRKSGLDPQDWQDCAADLSLIRFPGGNHELIFHRDRLRHYGELVQRKLSLLHDQHPKRWLFPIERVASSISFLDRPVLEYLLHDLTKQGILRVSHRGIGLQERGPELTRNQQKRLDWILDQYQESGLKPPSVADCVSRAEKNKQDVPDLIRMAIDSGDLVEIQADIILASDVLQNAWQVLRKSLAGGKGLTVAEIRDLLEISRKMAIPLCEYWDRQGQLQRDGDLRFLRESTT